MPEGDAVFRTAQRLDRCLTGEVLTVSDFRWPSLATVDLRGRSVDITVPCGKHLLTRVEGGATIHSHLRMDGSWRVTRAGRRPPGGHGIRVILGNARSSAVGVQLGMLDVVPTDQEHTLVGHLGPDLLDPQWSDDHVSRAIQNLTEQPQRCVGEALLDQRNLAGLGTIWTAEPLFACGIVPDRRVGDLTDLVGLVRTARKLLRTAALGDLRPQAKVYKRERLPCRICGTTITSTMVGTPPEARRIYFCPSCQK